MREDKVEKKKRSQREGKKGKRKNNKQFERDIRRLKKKWEKTGGIREIRSRSFYLKTSEQKKIASSKKRRR